MAEAYRAAFAAAGGEVHQGAGNGCGGADGHRRGTHHRVVQLAHGQRADQQVDIAGRHQLAAGGAVVAGRGDEGDLRRVLAGRGFLGGLDQAHAQGTGDADPFEARQLLRVAVDLFAQLGAAVADLLGIDEHRGNPGVDHGRLEGADPRHLQVVHQVAGGEYGAAVLAVVGRVEELQHDLGRREGHSVQLEVAGFLDLAAAHRHVGDDGLADIGLPDAHLADAVFRYPRRIHQPGVQGEGAGPGGEVAAVAAPVDEGLVDGDLAVEVVDVMARLAALREDHALAGAGGGAAHPVDVRGIGVGTADHPHEQPVARLAGDPAGFRQVFQAEEHALAGAAAQVGGGDADLGWVGHASSSSAIEFKGSGCVRQPLPVVGG